MFHEGDLQTGIALAIQESKSVICFVTDNGDESKRWESEWLQAHNIPETLSRNAVILKIEAESQEAGYLSAFCPVTDAPMLAIIFLGQLEDRLLAGISKNDFTLRLLRAINRNKQTQSATQTVAPPVVALSSASETRLSPPDEEQASSAASRSATATNSLSGGAQVASSSDHQVQSDIRTPTTGAPSPASPQQSFTTASSTTENVTPNDAASRVQRMLAERRVRLEAEQKARETAERADRIEREKARKQEAADAAGESSGVGTARSSRVTYAQEQVQRKKQDRLDRERVLKQLEMDKLERKEKEERRRAAARAENIASDEIRIDETKGVGPSKQTGDCFIQVRLIDGGTIRSKFARDNNLASDVRRWVDQSRTDGGAPYTFKQILTPMPNRSLSTSDEHQTLQENGLLPSATLIQVPVPGYSETYGGGKGGFVRSKFEILYGYIAALITAIIHAVQTFLGRRPSVSSVSHSTPKVTSPQDTPKSNSTGSASNNAGTNIRIRTLRDQEADKDDQQLYNGNQLNFEPNRKDDDDQDL